MNTIAERLEIARTNITNFAKQSGRKSEEIQLLAVSKTKPIADIQAAYDAGQRQFGENYVQEGVEKINYFSHLDDITWHFIGPLQSNKTKPVAESFAWVHGVEREKIAKRLNDQRPENMPPLNVCIQVNISGEESKSGVLPDAVKPLADFISQCPSLTLRGLMAIPAKTDTEQAFSAMQELYLELKKQFPTIDTLSMGMSGDLAHAINHGSTMVRIGTAIFGARDYK